MAEIIKKTDKNTIKRVADEIRNGKIAVFPTDTVYGLGTNAFNPVSVKKIYKIKSRNYRKPLPLLISSIESVRSLVKHIPDNVEVIANKYWPGPLTLVLETSDLGNILMSGRKTIAVRIPDNKFLLSLIRELRVPLVGTSANISGRDVCRCVSDISGNILTDVDIIIDTGMIKSKSVSTVLDVTRFHYVVAREGEITRHELKKFLKI
ncbi:MAG: Threonylcarbamoyl-AMP synthase [Elusimicrobia bacterium ADurb.Bin231]|nr:MAG: Threonylcarbamoyl-AMP synthase [Elusimicrobia bacterium ADurb.Bin231]